MKPKLKPKKQPAKKSYIVSGKKERFSLECRGNGRYNIVAFGSRVFVGPMSLKAIKANPQTKTMNLSLGDALVTKEELERLMEDMLADQNK